jgi:small subunit ribosomal protein S4
MQFAKTCMSLGKRSLQYWVITEWQLLKYVDIVRRAKGSTSQVFLQLLEMRLDNVIFWLGMAI